MVTMTTMLTTTTTIPMSATMTTTMRKTTKKDNEAHDVLYFPTCMSLCYPIRLTQADFAAHFYSELRSVAGRLCTAFSATSEASPL